MCVLIHRAGDVGWYWHLVEQELRTQGHEVVASDLPCDDDATLVADGIRADLLVLVAGTVPALGEKAEDWFANTG